MEKTEAEINELEAKLQQALIDFVIENGEIKLGNLSTALSSVRLIHNKLIDKANDILTKQKV